MKIANKKVIVQLKFAEHFRNEVAAAVKPKLMEKMFNSIKKQPFSCILGADAKVLKAHKTILAASSAYLKVIKELTSQS